MTGVFVAGLVFALGLGISGMTHPAKIIGFLDFTGSWDPSLAFVMAGAIAIHGILYRLVRRRSSPLFATDFSVPARRDVDALLIVGAALFGTGWGLGGFCPGPAMIALLSGTPAVFVFIASMLAAMVAFERIDSRR
ncbi:MAG: DUF6691 family protein [bacterium]